MKKTLTNFQPGDIVSTPKFPSVDHVGIIASKKTKVRHSPRGLYSHARASLPYPWPKHS